MKNVAKKTSFALVIYSELIAGILCYILVAVVSGLLVWYAFHGGVEGVDDMPVVAVILAIFYLLCAVGGGWLISRFVKWKKLPDVLISADNEYLYFYTNKTVKIALKDVKSVFAGPESFFVHLFGGGYGVVEIETAEKKYKVYFVEEASGVPASLKNLLDKA